MTASSQRAFLTQSSRSAEETATASTATAATMPTGTAVATPAARSRTATAAESNQRMATERRRRAEGARRLARLERASSELTSYGRRRFDASADESSSIATNIGQGLTPATSVGSKCGLSPYTTVVMETETTPSPRGLDSDERQAGRMRARLMNELRLRQSEQPVRFRHDRTAQLLTQEGCLTARSARTTGGYPWPQAFKYTPFPEPRLQSWASAERRRAAEAAEAAVEAEGAEDKDNTAAQTVLIELAVQPTHLHPQLLLELPVVAVSQHMQQQQPRKASDSQLPTAPSFGGLAPSDGAGVKWQRSKSQAAVRKQLSRHFSVSTIGEEERSRRRAQLQTLAQVCAKLTSHRQATSKTDKKHQNDAIDYLVDEIEAAVANGGPLFNTQTDEPLPALACPGSLAKSREHLTRAWLRQQRFCGARQPPIIS